MIKVSIPESVYTEIEQRGQHIFFVHFDSSVVQDEIVECTEMGVQLDGVPTYSKLVAAIVTGKYDYDTQIAMLANKDDGDPDHAASWTEFQNWRTESKRLARIIFPADTSTNLNEDEA